MQYSKRIVITGIGLTAPNGDNLSDFRQALIKQVSGLAHMPVRYMGDQVAGICKFDQLKYQNRKALRRGTRAGSIAIYCANEAILDAGIELNLIDRSRVGVYLGITEHGNVETENEIYELHQNNLDTKLWSHHHNPRTVANSPAGEITLNLNITGPHYTIGSACAGGNAGLIQGVQQLLLGEVDFALAGGVSESPHTFGIFAAFAAQGALANDSDPTKAIKPLDINRTGTVISEGGCIYLLESLESAKSRGAKIYGEIVGYALNSDASDFVNPNTERQVECMQLALKRANMSAEQIQIVNMHATATGAGDISEAKAVQAVFGNCADTYINFTKGHIGHCMGAAGALELAGNLPSFNDNLIHPVMNLNELDPECRLSRIVANTAYQHTKVEAILNNSFGMLGINSAVIVKKYQEN